MPEVPPFPFIVGSGRCGSTLMRVMFDAHPDMAVPTELYFSLAPRAEWLTPDGSLIVDRVVADLEARPWYPRMKLEPGAYRAAIAAEAPTDYADVIRSLYGVYAQAQGKPRYGNKSPGHVASMPQLLALFPEAKFIHIVRDGRNVALSYMEHNFGPSDLAGSAEAWRNRVMRGRRAGAKLGPDRYTEVRYEDLLDDPEGQLRRLCAFVDLPFNDAVLRYYERVPNMVIGGGAHPKLSMPPTKGMRDWRAQMTPAQILLFESIAGDTLTSLHYEMSGLTPSRGDRLRIGMRKAVSDAPRKTRRRLRRTARWVRHRGQPAAETSGG